MTNHDNSGAKPNNSKTELNSKKKERKINKKPNKKTKKQKNKKQTKKRKGNPIKSDLKLNSVGFDSRREQESHMANCRRDIKFD